jgi:hypothetical protein
MRYAESFNPFAPAKVNAARAAEDRLDWRSAAVLWRQCDPPREGDALACDLLAASTELGDAWRALPEPRPEFRDFALKYQGGALARMFR